MHDFICTGITELWGTGREQLNKNKNTRLKLDLNDQPLSHSNANPAP